ncbi:hypothetical protein CEW88_18575 [Alloyangia pacifica]|uniref:BLUF domain-containing protein n=2 Tax=Alloyangia pacifica TaxID=311180 RepID=A0A2U8HIY3_9RHOB|nr:hypothetical protein CEW88_18575 [Alloyangia pacifica]
MARAMNRSLGVSGTLHRQLHIFTQYVEGPVASMAKVKEDILRDQRHRNIQGVYDGPIAERSFRDWAMGYTSEKDTCWE